MPDDFGDLDEFLVNQPKRLTVRGKVYEFPGEISGRAYLILQRLAAAAKAASRGRSDAGDLADEVLSDEDEVDLRGELMGDVEVEMARDGLTSAHLRRTFHTLMAWHMIGEEAAMRVWRSSGEAPAPNRAARRAPKGSASTTKSPASTSGTTTPLRKPRAVSPGPISSATGS